jgi:hypothetical protein
MLSHGPMNPVKSNRLIRCGAKRYPAAGVVSGHYVAITIEIRGLRG